MVQVSMSKLQYVRRYTHSGKQQHAKHLPLCYLLLLLLQNSRFSFSTSSVDHPSGSPSLRRQTSLHCTYTLLSRYAARVYVIIGLLCAGANATHEGLSTHISQLSTNYHYPYYALLYSRYYLLNHIKYDYSVQGRLWLLITKLCF